MLIIKRKIGESITIGDITIILKSSTSIAAQLAIKAPRSIEIKRTELIAKEQASTKNALARLEGSIAWTDYGNVSLQEAARLAAIQTSRTTFGVSEYDWVIETRLEGDESEITTTLVRVSLSATIIEKKEAD